MDLLQVAIERGAKAVDHRRIDLQPHANAQAIHQHPADLLALFRAPGLLFDDRRHDERLIRRAVRRVRRSRLPFRAQMPLHGAVGAPQDGEVARAAREKVRVGEKEPLGMRLGRLDALQDLAVFQPLCVVAQVGACVELAAKLGERPAFDEPGLGLGHIAARQLLEQLDRPQRLGEKVVAGLDVAAAAERARQRFELIRAHLDARALQLADRRAQARALRDFDFRGDSRHRYRRADVPRGVAAGAEHDEQQQCEESFQSGTR